MRADTGFHADEAGGHVGKAAFNLAARPLLTQHDGAGLVVANDMEGVLADVDTGDRDTGMSCASGHWAGCSYCCSPPVQHNPLVGREHGRTIPLAASTPIFADSPLSHYSINDQRYAFSTGVCCGA